MSFSLFSGKSKLNDGRIWRLDWFGGFEMSGTTEPRVSVSFKPLRTDWQDDPFHNRAVIHEEICPVFVRSGFLPKLTIGSFWRYEKPFQPRGYNPKKYKFEPLDISNDTLQIFPAGHMENGSYLMGNDHYIGPRFPGGFSSHILTIPYQGDPHFILIPCVEIFRFYYGMSTKLAKFILRGDTDLFNPGESRLDTETGLGHLQLRTQMDGLDAWIIGRFAFSDLALYEAKSVHKKLATDKANSELPTLVAKPPFEGRTSLFAEGKFIESMGKRRFLVFKLVGCSGAFPFRNLEYCRDNDAKADEGNSEEKKPAWLQPKSKMIGGQEIDKNIPWDLGLELEEEPSLLSPIRVCPNETVLQYLDLRGKILTRVFNVKGTYKSQKDFEPNIRYAPDPTSFSTGDGEWNELPIGPLELQTLHENDEESGKYDAWTITKSVDFLDQLSDEQGWQWSSILLFDNFVSYKDHCLSLLPHYHNGEPLGKFARIGRRSRSNMEPRCILVARIEIPEGSFYLMEFETRRHEARKFLLVATNDFEEEALPILRDIVAGAVRSNGVWDNDGAPYRYQKRALQHRWKTLEGYGEAIRKAYLGLVGCIA